MANVKTIHIEPDDYRKMGKYGWVQVGYYRIKINRSGIPINQVKMYGEDSVG